MTYQVTTAVVAAQKALVVKRRVKIEQAGDAIGAALGMIGAYLDAQGSHPSGAPFTRTFGFQAGELDFESGFPVSSAVPGHDEIMATELPKTTVATTIHVGSQETSEDAYKAIHAWMAANGKAEAGAPWEVYLSDPSTTPADQAKMQIYFPVR